MEVLVFILIIVFSVVTAGKRQQKGQTPAKRTPVKGRRPSDWLKQQPEELEEGTIENTGEIPLRPRGPTPRPRRRPGSRPYPSPSSRWRVQGQTSPVGSMKAPPYWRRTTRAASAAPWPTTTHEGESRVEHREHLAAMQRQEQEESLAQAAQRSWT